MTDFYTWPDHLQGCIPRLPSLSLHQRERLLKLSRLHPDRRLQLLRPGDEDFPLLNKYLSLNPDRLRSLLLGSP